MGLHQTGVMDARLENIVQTGKCPKTKERLRLRPVGASGETRVMDHLTTWEVGGEDVSRSNDHYLGEMNLGQKVGRFDSVRMMTTMREQYISCDNLL